MLEHPLAVSTGR